MAGEPKTRLMERYVEAAMATVKAWEDLCRRCDDEAQQDMEIRVVLLIGGKPVGVVEFRWHPGWQRAVPKR